MAIYNITNSPDNLSLENFESVAGKDGSLAKSSRFAVVFHGDYRFFGASFDTSQDLTFLCEAAEFPGRGLMTTDLRYYGPNFKAPFQSTYEDLSLTFLCRDEFRERQFFDDWINYINPVATFDFRYPSEYRKNVSLYQISDLPKEGSSNTGKATYVFEFEGIYPILVNPQQVTWADDNFHRLTVTFTYIRWHRSIASNDIGDGSNIKDILVYSADKRTRLDQRAGGTTLPILLPGGALGVGGGF